MCFLVWNVNGLIDKLSDPDFIEYITSFDLCCLIETFTPPNFDFSLLSKDFLVQHSPAVRFSRLGRASGGTIILVNKKIASFITEVNTDYDNILCVRLSKSLLNSEKDVLFVGIYNHPQNSIYYCDKDYQCTLQPLEDFMLSTLEKGEDVSFIIGGDLNARIGEWGFNEDEMKNESEQFKRQSHDKTVNNFGKRLMDLCCTFQLTPLNGFMSGDKEGSYTYYCVRGNSVIDYFLCSIETIALMEQMKVVNQIESQHMALELNVLCLPQIWENCTQERQTIQRVRWDANKATVFTEFMTSPESRAKLNEAICMIKENVHEALRQFTNVLSAAGKCMQQTIYIGGRKKTRNKWFDEECRNLKREVRRALNRYSRYNFEVNKTYYHEIRKQYFKTIKEKRKEYKKSLQDTLISHKNDSSRFWSTIRSMKKKKNEQPHIEMKKWKEHFENVLSSGYVARGKDTEEEGAFGGHEFTGNSNEVPELDREISEGEVRQAIRSLKNRKSSGLDEIPAEFLKVSETSITPFLVLFFNHLYENGIFPKEWTKSIIVPLLKKGDPSCPGNYRGVSLLSIVSKVFTHVINKRFYKWAETENKIPEEQAGFRKKYSTIDHIFTLTSMINKCLYSNKRRKLYIAFVDYEKAFDLVDRDRLWTILEKLKASTKLINMLKGMYSCVKSCVRWGAFVTDFFDCPTGVRQGCLLSPLIFSLLISEVAELVNKKGKHGYQFVPNCREIFLLLFADDIALISTSSAGLQNQINNLEHASDSLGLKVNTQKTKIMVFRKGGHLSRHENWFYKSKQLEVVNSYKYLGFTLTTKLSIENSFEASAQRAKGKIVELLRVMWTLGNMNMSIFFKLFDAQVKSMLLYSSEVWGLTQYKGIESIHLFAIKKFLNVGQTTPNTMVYGETGRYPLYVDTYINVVKYWFKLKKMDRNRLPRQALEMSEMSVRDIRNCVNGKQGPLNWVYKIRELLNNFGFSYVWLHGGVGDEKMFLSELKLRIIDCYKQSWNEKINTSVRFETYRSFKSLLEPEKYLLEITISKFRNAMIRCRLGLNDLKVNQRYKDVPVTRCCPFCDKIENEFHFFVECPTYKDLRRKYISEYYDNQTINVSCTVMSLMKTENPEKIKKVAMYIYYAFKLREESL